MPDWRKSMQQTYEFCLVDPATWKDIRPMSNFKSGSINRDSTVETLGSATFNVTESPGECYVRVYLVTVQNGVRERTPLGTFLIQTPSWSFDGKTRDFSVDAYTPLLELKENPPPLGYSILKGENIMDNSYRIVREQARAPVVATDCTTNLYSDFVANTDDTWLSFLIDLAGNAKYEFALDELGRILFVPKQDTASLQPVWTYDDGDDSILYHDVSVDQDLYGIPNVVEVVYSDADTSLNPVVVVNDDPNSPVSTVNRGRRIVYRETDPNLVDIPDLVNKPIEEQVREYAERLLRELSTLEYTVTYTHGYCPVRLGDCVRINYSRAGLNGVKAKVISQNIKLDPGCKVKEKAVFSAKLWG